MPRGGVLPRRLHDGGRRGRAAHAISVPAAAQAPATASRRSRSAATGRASPTRRRASTAGRRGSRSAASTPCRCVLTPAGTDEESVRAGRGRRGARPAVGRPRVRRLPPAPRRRSAPCARSRRRAERGRVSVAEPSTSRTISVEINGERLRARGRRPPAARPLHPRRPRADGHAHRLRHRQLRRLHGPPRRPGGEELHAARRPGRRLDDRDGRGPRAGRRADARCSRRSPRTTRSSAATARPGC